MYRSNFSYPDFVKGIIDNNDVPVSPSGMVRDAIRAGSPHEGDILRKKLRDCCDSLANQPEYKRIKEKGVRGYLYRKS
jgi:hypothetical protein